MLRIESYVTPIILSYVDKYIKNLKPEDSKVSLWGGDAVFNNLDLKLDVLEEELKLPFSFLNGHIHELRIHVPWTKLISEPIVITINTIECILKLKDYSQTEDESSTQSNKDSESGCHENLKRQKRQDLETPTSYIQGLINKLINNVVVVFNNVILKYVEDDIVLSINAKTIELRSVDGNWIPAFIDLTSDDPVLRNLVMVTDLTVCLDKRNASGKIEVYQEPFLYRCSLSCRIVRQFESVYSFQPRITRYDVFCSQLHFSLSDTQLPMFIRLLELLLALYYKQLQYQPTSVNKSKKESFGTDEDASFSEGAEENTWSSWAWAIGSSLNPFQWEEYEDSGRNHSSRYNGISHLGVYIETATWIFKMTELSQENTFFGASKLQFTSFLKLIQNGSFFTCVVKGLEAVNVQMGISSLSVVPVGKCICGLADFLEETWREEDVHPYIFIQSGGKSTDYISSSLFDETSNQLAWNYKFVWDEHINNVTVNSLMNKSSSFGMDYLFVMDIPAEASSEILSEINANPESVKWNSRALCHCVFGPFKANICSSLVHRISAIIINCQQSEYSPYPSLQTEDGSEQTTEFCEEEIEYLETGYPKREYIFSLIEPTIYISWAQHEVLDVKSVLNSKFKKRCTSTSLEYKPFYKSSVPSITGCCSRIELNITKPMYPRVLTKAAMTLKSLSEKMLHNCHLHLVLKVHSCSLGLFYEDVMSVPVLENFSLNLYAKSLLLPKLWISSSQPLSEIFVETDQVTIFLSIPQIHLIYYLASSWFIESPSPEKLQKTLLIDDAIYATKKFEMLKFELQNLDFKFCKANHLNAWYLSFGKLSFALCKANKDIISFIANGPDAYPNVGDASSSINEKLFRLSLQFPVNNEVGLPIIFSTQILKFTSVFNPQFLLCLRYSPKPSPRKNNEELIRKLSDMKFNSRKVWKKCFESETENVKIDSSSATLSEAKTSNRARFGLLATTQEVASSNWRERFIEFSSFMNNLIICIEIEPWTIIFPLKSINITSNSGLANAIHRFYLTRGEKNFLEDTAVICMPYILLRNATQKDNVINSFHDVPITFPQISFFEGKDMLPWSLKLTNFQMYTLQSAGETMKLSVVEPVSTMATFAITPKSKGSSLSQLGVVIHLDMSSLDFHVCRRQVEMQVAILERFLNIFSFYVTFMSKDISETLSTFSETCIERESIKEKKSFHEEFPSKTVEGKENVHKTLNFFNREESKVIEHTSTNSQKDCSIVKPSISDQFLNMTQGDAENLNDNHEDEMKTISVSVTLWVQLTVAKASATFFVTEKEESKKLKAEIEDFTLGVDLHQIYSKIKCKIATISVFHHINQRNSEWLKGEKGGVVLTVGDELTRDLLTLDSINRPPSDRPRVLNPTSISHSDKHPKSCGFLSLIITKAQCKNIHSRWNQMIKKHLRDERCVKECNSPKYLCEVDLRMQSFDCVLFSPVLEKFASVFEPLLHIQLPPKHLFKTLSDLDKPSPFGSEINNKVLPLIYVHTEPIRVFLPAKDEKLPIEHMHDVILLQLESLMISPHVDNPLSRLILRQDIFTAAEQARILTVPGSEVEDRQYQMDFSGFSISTGFWNDIINLRNGRPRSFSSERMGITGENPAFEWNNYDPTKDKKNIHMYPVIARLDTRVIFAPAIVYETSKENVESVRSLFVAGHSLEVNALTDCEFYASTSQICLINKIMLDSLSMISHILTHKSNKFHNSSSSDWLDSGVDCDVSSIEILKQSSLVEQNNTTLRKCSILDNFVPLEVLITGNKVSLSVYEKCSVDENRFPLKIPQKNRPERRGKLKEKALLLEIESTESEPSPKRVKMNHSQKSQLLTTLPMDTKVEEGYEGSEEESVYEFQLISSEAQIRIIPLLYLSISQPHTFFTLQPQKQKVDVSFFDISIKSVTKGSSIKATEMKRMPSSEDYNVSWLETRPGDTHPKTGIPPAFFTFSAYNFLNKKAQVSIDVGRPVRVVLSNSKWDQILHVISYIEKVFPRSSSLLAENRNDDHQNRSQCVNEISFLNMLRLKLKRLENISFSTSQIIINTEILSNTDSKYELLTSFSALTLNLSIIRKRLKQKGNNLSEEFISELNLNFFVKGLQFKSSCYNLTLHPLMKPWSVSSEVKFVWYQWKTDPYIKMKINSEVLQIELGPETLYALQEVNAALHNLFLWFSSEKENLPNDNDVNKPVSELYSDSFFQDDLRAGVFEYLDYPPDNSSISFPKPYQVFFDKNKNAMVWCYPEPRALTKVEIFPVPFVAANVADDMQVDGPLFILCSLQYFDEIRNSFVTYRRFKLSESHICSLDLPGIHELNLLAVSTIWRVCINSNDDNDDTNQNVKGPIFLSPEALAACIRVDSLFSVSILPIVQVVFIISKWNLTFFNHLDVTGSKLISPLEELKPDDSVPTEHSFITFSFDDVFSRFSVWNEECFCDVSCKISSQVLNYKYLTNNLLLEPASLFLDFSIKNHELISKCCDCNIAIKRVCINIDQSTLHTLTVAKQCWNQAFVILKNFESVPNIKYSLPIIFMSNYYIANKTVESIRFGQVNTPENILLESGNVHFYSWRSQRFSTKLQISNEGSKWKWCEAFKLDREGTQVYSVANSDGRESKFFITQKKFSPTQMIVYVNGFLTIANCLYNDIDIRICEKQCKEDNYNKTSKPHNAITVKCRTFSPSFFCEPYSIRIKSSCSSVWSGEIPLSQESATVRIPLKKKKESVSIICKIYRENMASLQSKILIAFCPHFVVRSHLPRPLTLFVNTPNINSSQKETIKGRGKGHPLNCDPSQSHQVTLQLSPDLEVSKPAIQINRSLIEQVKNSGSEFPDLSLLMEDMMKCPSERWPYIDSDLIQNNLLFADQPRINLQIEFSSLLPNCRSLVIDIRPWILIVNHTNTEILLNEGSSNDNVWYIPPGAVFSPPKLESTFTFGIVETEKPYFCSSLSLSTEEHWYALKFDGRVPKIGSTNISIRLQEKICFFTILCRYEENIQIMHLLPTFSISNNTDQEFTLRVFSVCESKKNIELPLTLSSVTIPPNLTSSSDLQEVPLLVWDSLKSSHQEETKTSLFLQFGLNDRYCFPVSFLDRSRDLRISFTIPTSEGSNEAFILTTHPNNSQVKFVIQKDFSPQMKLYNNTSVPLLIGQGNLASVGIIEEENVPFNSVPIIKPRKAIFYTFPHVSASFPEIMPPNKAEPKLHLAFSKQPSSGANKIFWSHGLNISEENDQFVNIQGFSDVKVSIEKSGHTAHIFIDPVNRIEISAKDIRSRIASTVMPLHIKEKEETFSAAENCDKIGSEEIPCEAQSDMYVENKYIYYFSFKSSDFSIVFREDLNKENYHLEFIRLTLDFVHLNFRPLFVDREIYKRRHLLNNRIEVILLIEDVQIDNQMFSEGNFDFPVILVRQNGLKGPSRSSSKKITETEKFLYLSSTIDFSPLLAVQNMNITMKPLTLYLEDTLIYYTLLFFNNVGSSVNHDCRLFDRHEVIKTLKIWLPREILLRSKAMTRPLQIGNLSIEAVSVLLSIHASVKLYIALDQSPLHFKEYRRKAIITTGYSLGYNLTVHYLSNALLRAGWVVTSLDLLGNPGGFARTVGSGLRDFVQLPIEGILQGPWAFVAGITHGSLSLIKHISTGTLVSVTNLASSVARNMERLSLDEDHLTRNEANRRSKPKGISNSVLQGFSSFGLSILGAIGGLAHQPIQAVLQDDVSASQLIGSFGKGVVGVVTKPIGGVADLVVHTGQGLLQGAGWQRDLQVRIPCERIFDSSFSNSSLKYVWKLLVSLPKECRTVICAVDAMFVTHTSSYSPVTILLTPQVLFIVDVVEDTHQQLFTLHDLKWKCHPHDPTLLYLEKVLRPVLNMNEDAEPISGCPERVADYVRSTFSECFDVSQLDYDSNDEEREDEMQIPKTKIYLSAQLRNFLISCIEITVRSNKGQGFISQ